MAIRECETEQSELRESARCQCRSCTGQGFPYQWESTQLGLSFQGEFHVPGVVVIDAKQSGSDERRHDEPESSKRCPDRKSTRLNSSHLVISYAVFCLKKQKTFYR